MIAIHHSYASSGTAYAENRELLEIEACAMVAERLVDEMDSAVMFSEALRRRTVESIASDCEMLSARYGALFKRLTGSRGRHAAQGHVYRHSHPGRQHHLAH